MPIYQFQCECGHAEQKLQAYEVDAPEHCGSGMTRLISSPGRVILKGTGFYATEWGNGARHLEPADQARRAAREVKERNLVMATPQGTNAGDVKEYKRQREAGLDV